MEHNAKYIFDEECSAAAVLLLPFGATGVLLLLGKFGTDKQKKNTYQNIIK